MEINLSKVIPFVLVIFATLTAISSYIRNMPNTEHESQIFNERSNAIINLTIKNQNKGAQFEDAAIIQRIPDMERIYHTLQGNYYNLTNATKIYGIDENMTKRLEDKESNSKINGNKFNHSITSIINNSDELKNLKIYRYVKNSFGILNTDRLKAIQNYSNNQKLKSIENISNGWKSLILRYQKYSVLMAMAIFNQNGDLKNAQNYIGYSNKVKEDFPLLTKYPLPEVALAEYVINNEKNTPRDYLVDYPSCKINTECTIDEINSIGSNLTKFVDNGLLFHMDKPTNKIISITNPLISFVNSLTLVFLIFLMVSPIVTIIAIKEFLFK
jgi:hypothetical protein